MGDQKKDRKYPRLEKLWFTAVKSYDKDGELEEGYTGTTLNVSEGGMLVETENPLPFQVKINLTLALDDELIKLKGEVAHLKEREDGLVEMGFKFVEIGEKELKILRNALKKDTSS